MKKYLNRFEVPDTAKYVIIDRDLLRPNDLTENEWRDHSMTYEWHLRRISDNRLMFACNGWINIGHEAWVRNIPYNEVEFIYKR